MAEKITPEQEALLKKYLMSVDKVPTGGGLAEEVMRPKYEDTGREVGSPIERIVSYTGAPSRRALAEMLAGRSGAEGFRSQFGKDPALAPEWTDIVGDAGVSDPYLMAGAGTALDLLEPVPGVGLLGRGIPGAGAIYKQGKKLSGKEAKEELAKLIEGESVKDPRYLYLKKTKMDELDLNTANPNRGLRQEHAYTKGSQFGWLHDEGMGNDPVVVSKTDQFPYDDFSYPGGLDRMKKELALSIIDAEKTPVLKMMSPGTSYVMDEDIARIVPGPTSPRVDSSLSAKLYGRPGKGSEYVVDNPIPDYVLTNKELAEYMRSKKLMRKFPSSGKEAAAQKAEAAAQAQAAHLEGEKALEVGDQRGANFYLAKGELDEKAVAKRMADLDYEIENAKTVLEKRKLEAKKNALAGAEYNTISRKNKKD